MNYLFINRICQQCSLNLNWQFENADLNGGQALYCGKMLSVDNKMDRHWDFFFIVIELTGLKNGCEWIFLASRAYAEPAKNVTLYFVFF